MKLSKGPCGASRVAEAAPHLPWEPQHLTGRMHRATPWLEPLDLGAVAVREASPFSVCCYPQPWGGRFALCAPLPEGALPARAAARRLWGDRDPADRAWFLTGRREAPHGGTRCSRGPAPPPS